MNILLQAQHHPRLTGLGYQTSYMLVTEFDLAIASNVDTQLFQQSLPLKQPWCPQAAMSHLFI